MEALQPAGREVRQRCQCSHLPGTCGVWEVDLELFWANGDGGGNSGTNGDANSGGAVVAGLDRPPRTRCKDLGGRHRQRQGRVRTRGGIPRVLRAARATSGYYCGTLGANSAVGRGFCGSGGQHRHLGGLDSRSALARRPFARRPAGRPRKRRMSVAECLLRLQSRNAPMMA